MLQYRMIEIFTNEEARWQGSPLADAVVQYIHDRKAGMRCLVTRGMQGCYENGEIATERLVILSYNMPVRITIVAPIAEVDRVLPEIEKMVTDGIVTVQELAVVAHKTRSSIFPRHIRVLDIMTASPSKVTITTPLNDVVRLLLSSVFTGVPVVDKEDRPVGVITQNDLIYKAGLPMRLGLLAVSSDDTLAAVLASLAEKKTRDVMTTPALCIREDRLAVDAVELMLENEMKRLPVVDVDGRLTGILSRLDIFRAIMKEAPDWKSFREQQIEVDNIRLVSDIMRRDSLTARPETTVEDVIQMIDANDIQRVAVVDGEGRFLGLIFDRDLLVAFSATHYEGIWGYFVSKISFSERGRKYREFRELLRARTAAEVMQKDIVTIGETATLDEAIRLMTDKGFKRLPVLDSQGRFRGMISRDSLLRTGFGKGGNASVS
ncbi:MAG: DUF190 domain-containing protein [Thermodesulfobacteriota bacterium]